MIKLICVGSIKEQYIKEAINDYFNRINKLVKLKIVEVNEEISNIEKETINILSKIKEKDYKILLDLNGSQYNTTNFSKKINDLFLYGKSNVTFIIGGSNGVSEKLKNIVDEKISFSKLTFPHQLFRVIFLEQLYRIFKILNNEPYHK